MASTEELRLLIRAVADDQGLKQTSSSVDKLGKSSGEVGKGFEISRESALRFVGALTGVELGLSVATSAGSKLREVLVGAVEAQASAERTSRALVASYGAQAAQFSAFADRLSTQTSFTSQAIQEAALSARTLSTNYGLTIEQTQRLIAASADLAQVRGIGVAEAFERVQSAIRGEAEASEFLGLTVNDTFIKNNALNGSVRKTFETMTDAQKAQIRYGEILRQTAAFQGIAAGAAGGLDGALSRASVAAQKLSLAMGRLIEPTAIDALQAEARVASDLEIALDKLAKARANARQLPGGGGLESAFVQALPVLGPAASIATVFGEALHKLAEPEREAALAARQAAIQTAQLTDAQADINSQLASGALHARQLGVGLNQVQRESRAAADALAQLDKTLDQINDFRQSIPANSPLLPELGAQADLQQIEKQRRVAKQASDFLLERRKTLEQTATGALAGGFGAPPGVAADAQRQAQQQLATLDQLIGKERELATAKAEQATVNSALAAAQAGEALAQLQILPQQQEVARLEREITEGVDRRRQLRLEETRLLAQQRALIPNEALEDTQATIRRNQLLLATRGLDPEARRAARAEIRDLSRNALPGQELAAFDANRQVTLAQRGEQHADLDARLRANPIEQQIAAINDSTKTQRDSIFAIQQYTEGLNLVGQALSAKVSEQQSQIDKLIQAAAQPTKVELTVNVDDGQNVTQIYQELIEARGQTQLPPAVQLSGVRRS